MSPKAGELLDCLFAKSPNAPQPLLDLALKTIGQTAGKTESAWTDQKVRSKILHDTVSTIAPLEMRKSLVGSGISISEISSKTQSLMCHRDRHGKAQVETPDRKTKEYYKLMGIEVPSMARIEQFKKGLLGMAKM